MFKKMCKLLVSFCFIAFVCAYFHCPKNITVEGEQLPYSQLMGFDDGFNIQNVLLENFYLHGIKVNSTYHGLITTINTEKLTFK